ncbi:hypothetical protein QA601_04715 [Chitinispirillales bacterium ANBcel5]|uniref:hypothetical protein n=1 Tax=Cellulosispirillum alkaliphilum TaxID=3039283 RepID=UPI002A52BDD0|nr:hypothetical protein [Chitinispirillales bacterium ANBcel5]
MRVVPILFVALLLSGCGYYENQNELRIRNEALAGITVNFRANVYYIPSGGLLVIDEVPNGVYDYATTYQVPPGITEASAEGDASGEVVFTYRNTKNQILFSSFIELSDDGAEYILSATRTSTHAIDNIDLVSPKSYE